MDDDINLGGVSGRKKNPLKDSKIFSHIFDEQKRTNLSNIMTKAVEFFWWAMIIYAFIGLILMFAAPIVNGHRFDLTEFITGFRVVGDGLSQLVLYIVIFYRAYLHLNTDLHDILSWVTTIEVWVLVLTLLLQLSPAAVFEQTGPGLLSRLSDGLTYNTVRNSAQRRAPSRSSYRIIKYAQAKLYREPKSQSVIRRKNGKYAYLVKSNRVQVLDRNGNFTKVSYKGNVYWILTNALK